MDTMNVLLMGLLIFGLLGSGFTHPTKSDADDYQGDDYNDDYIDESNSDAQSPDDVSPSVGPPTVDMTAYKETVHVKENVILHCDVKNLGGSSIIWYNGTTLLAHGKYTTNDKRVSVTKDLGLEIKNVTIYDSGVYVCKILPSKLEIHATLEVDSRPILVKIFYDNRDVTQKTITFDPKKGSHELVMKCLIDESIPDATVTWTFNGKKLTEYSKDDIAIEENSLTLLKPSNHNSGTYQCVLNHKSGKPAHGSVIIHVKHHPIFPKHRDYVNTAVGSTAELHCVFTADPLPKSVRWFKNDPKTRLHPSEKYEIIDDSHSNHNRSKLVIRSVEPTDLGAYHCEVENSIGKASEKITLGLEPSPALFEKYDYKRNLVTAVWTVKSIQPISEMQVLYKTKNSSWKTSPATTVDASQCASGECQIIGSMELPPGEWIVAARTKNTEGWSHSESSLHTLKIPVDYETTNGSSKATQLSLLTVIIFTLSKLM